MRQWPALGCLWWAPLLWAKRIKSRALGKPVAKRASTGDYRDTTQGAYGTEYRYNANLAQLNVLPLNNYGYDGTGINVAVVDSGIDTVILNF